MSGGDSDSDGNGVTPTPARVYPRNSATSESVAHPLEGSATTAIGRMPKADGALRPHALNPSSTGGRVLLRHPRTTDPGPAHRASGASSAIDQAARILARLDFNLPAYSESRPEIAPSPCQTRRRAGCVEPRLPQATHPENRRAALCTGEGVDDHQARFGFDSWIRYQLKQCIGDILARPLVRRNGVKSLSFYICRLSFVICRLSFVGT